MIINNKANNKDGQHQHIPTPPPPPAPPPPPGGGGGGGEALVPSSLLLATSQPTPYPFTSYVLRKI